MTKYKNDVSLRPRTPTISMATKQQHIPIHLFTVCPSIRLSVQFVSVFDCNTSRYVYFDRSTSEHILRYHIYNTQINIWPSVDDARTAICKCFV